MQALQHVVHYISIAFLANAISLIVLAAVWDKIENEISEIRKDGFKHWLKVQAVTILLFIVVVAMFAGAMYGAMHFE